MPTAQEGAVDTRNPVYRPPATRPWSARGPPLAAGNPCRLQPRKEYV